MINLVVTGALGHIGSQFIRQLPPYLVNRVVLIDNLSTQRYCSLFNLPENIRYQFVEEDICTTDLDRYIAGADVVVHLAAITNAEGSLAIRDQVEHTNFVGTERVAEACARHQCKMLFLSTTSVYGTQSEVVDEACAIDELKPQSPYAESKLRAELMLQEKGATAGLKFITCRFGTIVGASPGMRFHTAINKFIWLAATNRPLTVWRTALHQRRPYLTLRDAVDALIFIVEHDIFDGRVYNVLTTNSTVNDIIGIIRSYIPETQVSFVDSAIMNQLSYTVSNQRFQDLGFRFSGSLHQEISDSIVLLRGIAPTAQVATPQTSRLLEVIS